MSVPLLHSLQSCQRAVSGRKTVRRASGIQRLLLQPAHRPPHRAGRCGAHQEADAGNHCREHPLPPCRMPHHRGCTHLQRTGHERQSEAAGNFRLAIYLLLHTGRHRRLLLRQPVAQYRIHLAVRYREVLRRPAATHPQPGKPRCPGRSGETEKMLDVFRNTCAGTTLWDWAT